MAYVVGKPQRRASGYTAESVLAPGQNGGNSGINLNRTPVTFLVFLFFPDLDLDLPVVGTTASPHRSIPKSRHAAPVVGCSFVRCGGAGEWALQVQAAEAARVGEAARRRRTGTRTLCWDRRREAVRNVSLISPQAPTSGITWALLSGVESISQKKHHQASMPLGRRRCRYGGPYAAGACANFVGVVIRGFVPAVAATAPSRLWILRQGAVVGLNDVLHRVEPTTGWWGNAQAAAGMAFWASGSYSRHLSMFAIATVLLRLVK
ncbi:hypothetical protein C8R45DRAFT_927595 [Mycena sanguinolenta]|nr:hypothetical protein C8R45DRAFT_927595 [Mycena sanguinolenta]